MTQSNSRVKVVIPARIGSHRLPNKPLIDLAGTPMIVRVFHAVQEGLGNNEIVVAVDDEQIMRVLELHGIPGVMTDRRVRTGTDRVAAVARDRQWQHQDIIINVQGDEPLVPPDLLRQFASFCLSQDNLSMATVSVPVKAMSEVSDPNIVKLITRSDGSALTFSRAPIPFDRDRQQNEWNLNSYRRHLGIYAYRNDVLQHLTATPPCRLEQLERLEQLRALWLGLPIQVMGWHESPPGGVDTVADVERVIAHINRAL